MFKFSANLGLLWTEMSQIDAIYKAKKNGFDAVEFQFPYQYDSREIKKALDDVNLPVMGINTIKGNIEKNPGFFLEYFELRCSKTLKTYKRGNNQNSQCRAFICVTVDGVRLIDNLLLNHEN